MQPDAQSTANVSGAGFVPLAPLLRSVAPEKFHEARRRLAGYSRVELLDKFRSSFANGKRVAAFILAEELNTRGIPPCFRHHHLSSTAYTTSQTYDLLVNDVRWIRRRYEHARVVKFRRCRALFVGSESSFHQEAQFSFYGGGRAAWKIVKSLSLTEEQQLDCYWLRSAPIAKRLDAAQAMRDRVFRLLQDDLQATRRTKSFNDDDAKATLLRRHRLWVCRGHTTGGPVEIAKKFEQLTGQVISRQVVSRQLQLVDDVIKKGREK